MKNKKTKKLLKQVKKLVNRKHKVIISLNIQKLVEQSQADNFQEEVAKIILDACNTKTKDTSAESKQSDTLKEATNQCLLQALREAESFLD